MSTEAEIKELLTYLEGSVKKLDKTDMATLLRLENAFLKHQIQAAKNRLQMAEIRSAVPQVFASLLSSDGAGGKTPANRPEPHAPKKEPQAGSTDLHSAGAVPADDKVKGKVPANRPAKPAPAKKGGAPPVEERPIDISRLDMRIGLISKAEKHRDADTLYVETVEVGEATPRTIVSGLAKAVPLDQLIGSHAVFLLNLKPAKLKGISSQGMIMCSNKDGVVRVLRPPPGVVAGERVTCAGYTDPPDAVLNPKKKVWETLQPNMLTNASGAACWEGKPWVIEGKGEVTTDLTGAAIK